MPPFALFRAFSPFSADLPRACSRRAAATALAGVTLLALAGCGGGEVDRKQAQLRLVNATQPESGYAALALRRDDQLVQGQVAYGQNSLYAGVDDGGATLSVTSPDSPTPLLSTRADLGRSRHYTLLALGPRGALRQLLLDDNEAEPEAGKALLRVVNAAPDAGALDVYLTGPSDSLATAVPLQAAAAYGSVGGWFTVASGSWQLRVTAAGNRSDLRLDLPALTLDSRARATLVITPTAGAVLTHALLLAQRGNVTALDNTQARLRLVAGLAGGGAVSLSLNGAPLLQAVPSPSAGLYQAVAAGTPLVGVTAVGQPLAVPPITLDAGRDYTLLVSGNGSIDAGVPARASWLKDDNRAAADASQARLRLVNGLASASQGLTMTVDFQPVGGSATPGAAGSYGDVAASSTAVLNVTGEGLTAPLLTRSDQVLAAGGTYSVFLVGAPAAPVGIVRRDR